MAGRKRGIGNRESGSDGSQTGNGRGSAATTARASDSRLPHPDSRGRPSDSLTRAQKLDLYYWMRLTRSLEERLVALYRQTKVVGGLFRSLGRRLTRSAAPMRSSVATSCRR
jgi:TPP-dependent pyruvate/acetoin dehydrogenase alpha subunit